VVGLAIVAGGITLANSIGGAMTKAATCIDDGTSASC
jgi:hypothetical protein